MCYNTFMQEKLTLENSNIFKSGVFMFHKNAGYTLPNEQSPSPTDKEFISHSHKHYELLQLLDGDTSLIIEGKIYRLTAGDVALIRPNDFHILKINDPVYFRRVLEFYPDCLKMQPAATEWLLKPFSSEEKHFNNYLPKTIIENSDFNALFNKIENTVNDKTLDKELRSVRISVLMAELLLCIHSLFLKNGEAPREYVHPVCREIISYIHKNIGKRILLTDMEKSLNLSRFYLSHEFKKHMGISIASYIVEKKILYAEKLIESGVSPTEASFAVAYNYPNFFSNYKKILHKTPKESVKKNDFPPTVLP